MIWKRIAAKGINALLILLLIVLSYLLFPHQNEYKDYIAATLIAFSTIAFLPILTTNHSLGYSFFKLKSKQRVLLITKYLIIYLCFSIPTQYVQLIFNESISLVIEVACVATIFALSIESFIIILSSKGKYDCLDYLLGIEYNEDAYKKNSWLKGTLLLILCFVFTICFSFITEMNYSWQNISSKIRSENQTYGQEIYFEWDRLYGLCNSIFVIKGTTQDICLPSDIESFIREKDCKVWTVYISCNKHSINNLERRKAIVQEIAWSLRFNQIDALSLPECYRLILYYSNYTTPFSTEAIFCEYFLNRDITHLSGGVDINAVLEFNRLIHNNYSQLVQEVLINTQCDSLFNRYTSGSTIELTPDLENAIVHQCFTHIDPNTTPFAIPIISFEDVKPIHSYSVGFTFPRTIIDFSKISNTPEKLELETYRKKSMPFSFYYLNDKRILSSFKSKS